MLASLRASRSSHPVLGTIIALLAIFPSRVIGQGQGKIDSASFAPGIKVPATRTGASSAVVDSNDVRASAALTFSELLQARAARH